jgi:predicted DNA binding protein
MSYIVEFEAEFLLIRETGEAVPEMEFQTEGLHILSEDQGQFVFWASGDDFEKMESALDTDSTVEDYALLTKFHNRRLYRVTLSEEGTEGMTYPIIAEYDIQVLSATTTSQETQVRARVPTRDALKNYIEVCEDREIPLRLNRLYPEATDDASDRYGLTEKQHDVLVHAHKRGYFEEPRKITLEELADEFEVSPSALGRRLRRAHNKLIDATLSF